ncbi:50S ribosomal protein L19 [Candidatus Wolfebacteria bacterium]|nr:50S ribosomal protein L19 [Candidatus Wolfebacteria bacterium]
MHTVISPVNIEERKTLGIKPGDTVRVHQKIQEKGKTRIQLFEGLVIAVKHGAEAGATFTVRTTLSGVGIEKIYPLYSPNIDKIEIVKRSKVRRSKLYFIREKVARETRRQLRRMRLMDRTTTSEREQAERRKKKEEEMAAKAEADEKAAEEAKVAEETKKTEEVPAAETAEEAPSEEKTEEVSTEEKKEEK